MIDGHESQYCRTVAICIYQLIQIGSDKYVFHRQGRVNATILTHFLRFNVDGLRVKHVNLAALLHQFSGPDLGLLFLLLSLSLVA